MAGSNRRIVWVTWLACILPFLFSLCYAVMPDESGISKVLYVIAKINLIAWPVICIRFVLKDEFTPVLRSARTSHITTLSTGALLGLGIVGLMFAMLQIPYFGNLVQASGPNIGAFVKRLGVEDHFIPFALFLSLIHSFMEEFYWRGFVFERFQRFLNSGLAHLLAAVGFAAHHVVITAQFFPLGFAFFLGFCVGMGGFFWTLLYQRQGTLLGIWLSHLIVDLGVMFVGYQAMMQAQTAG